jgi:hypothetical protein
MPEVEKIDGEGETLAIVSRRGENDYGFQIFTPKEFPLQFGVNKRNAGDSSPIHIHTPLEKPRQEVVHILKGKVKVKIYTKEGKAVANIELNDGDTALFTEGHGMDFLEDTEMLEIKQGPYPGTPKSDKLLLE